MPDRIVPALNSSDQELRADAEVRPEDIALALAWLRLYAPELYRLAEASPFERDHITIALMAGMLAMGTRYTYLTQRGLYFDLRSRRIVSDPEVQRLIDRALERASRDARTQTLALRTRTLDLPRWEINIRHAVKYSTTATHIVANGGVRRTHLDALARMQERVYQQSVFLRKFALQIETGEQPLDGRAVNRASQYVLSARAEYMKARAEVAVATGYDQARSLLADADHCETSEKRPGCVEEAARGWVPINDMVVPGERTCLGNCLCTLQWRNSRTGEVFGQSPARVAAA